MTEPPEAAAPHRRAALVRAELAARTSYGRLLALVAAGTHDIAGAEDALADAFERALRTWPVDGVPDRPDAWLLTVARNRQRDHWRSAEATRTTALDPDAHAPVHLDDVDPDAVPDRRLELMLVCAHPAISVGDRTPLMLNTVLGFTAEQVARSYAVPTRTMATRLVRAKRRIRDNRIPFRLPDRSQLPERMDAVLAAVYAAYVIEWSTGPGERDLPPEALHLAEVLAELVPDDAEVHGLAALVELSAARRPARLAADGRFVPLASQDTALVGCRPDRPRPRPPPRRPPGPGRRALPARGRRAGRALRAPRDRAHRLADPARAAPVARRRRPEPGQRHGPRGGDRARSRDRRPVWPCSTRMPGAPRASSPPGRPAPSC